VLFFLITNFYIDSASVSDHVTYFLPVTYFPTNLVYPFTLPVIHRITFFQRRLLEEVDILRRILKGMGIESHDLSIDNKSIAKTHITVRTGTCPIKIKILINFK